MTALASFSAIRALPSPCGLTLAVRLPDAKGDAMRNGSMPNATAEGRAPAKHDR
jgi:hypothetical protein